MKRTHAQAVSITEEPKRKTRKVTNTESEPEIASVDTRETMGDSTDDTELFAGDATSVTVRVRKFYPYSSLCSSEQHHFDLSKHTRITIPLAHCDVKFILPFEEIPMHVYRFVEELDRQLHSLSTATRPLIKILGLSIDVMPDTTLWIISKNVVYPCPHYILQRHALFGLSTFKDYASDLEGREPHSENSEIYVYIGKEPVNDFFDDE